MAKKVKKTEKKKRSYDKPWARGNKDSGESPSNAKKGLSSTVKAGKG